MNMNAIIYLFVFLPIYVCNYFIFFLNKLLLLLLLYALRISTHESFECIIIISVNREIILIEIAKFL